MLTVERKWLSVPFHYFPDEETEAQRGGRAETRNFAFWLETNVPVPWLTDQTVHQLAPAFQLAPWPLCCLSGEGRTHVHQKVLVCPDASLHTDAPSPPLRCPAALNQRAWLPVLSAHNCCLNVRSHSQAHCVLWWPVRFTYILFSQSTEFLISSFHRNKGCSHLSAKRQQAVTKHGQFSFLVSLGWNWFGSKRVRKIPVWSG